jgi:hypothetical protein
LKVVALFVSRGTWRIHQFARTPSCAGAHQVKDKTLYRSGCCQLARCSSGGREQPSRHHLNAIQGARRFTLESKPSACELRSSWAALGRSAGSRNLLWRRSCSTLTGLPTLSLRSRASRCFTLLAVKSGSFVCAAGSSTAHRRRERAGPPCVGSDGAATPTSRCCQRLLARPR